MSLFNDPSEETRQKISELQFRNSSVFDLLDQKLNRAKAISGTIACAALGGEKIGTTFADLAETASMLNDELVITLCLLEGWYDANNHTSPPHPFSRYVKRVP